MEVEVNPNKRTLATDLAEMYSMLPKKCKREIKDLYNTKESLDNDGRINNLVGLRERITPREEDYLRQVITYFYDFNNGNETMSFETIKNL